MTKSQFYLSSPMYLQWGSGGSRGVWHIFGEKFNFWDQFLSMGCTMNFQKTMFLWNSLLSSLIKKLPRREKSNICCRVGIIEYFKRAISEREKSNICYRVGIIEYFKRAIFVTEERRWHFRLWEAEPRAGRDLRDTAPLDNANILR